jgi:hypothetical protein
MKTEFEMIDLGLMKYFLGIEVEQYSHGIFFCQQKYATNILKRFRMDTCKPIALGKLKIKMKAQQLIQLYIRG